jgi:ribonuclease HI
VERAISLLRDHGYDIKQRNLPNPILRQTLIELPRSKIPFTNQERLIILKVDRELRRLRKSLDNSIPVSDLIKDGKVDIPDLEALTPNDREILKHAFCLDDASGKVRDELRPTLHATTDYVDKIIPLRNLSECHRIDGRVVIATDGSAKDGLAGYGVWFAENHASNQSGPVRNEQNNATAELSAIETALRAAPPRRQGYLILADAQSWTRAIEAYPGLSISEKKKLQFGSRLRIIDYLIREKHTNSIRFHHIYSHSEEKLSEARSENDDKRVERIEKNLASLGTHRELAIRANEGADALAAQGRETLNRTPNIIPNAEEKFFVTYNNVHLDQYVPKHLKTTRQERHRTRLLTTNAGRILSETSGKIDKNLSFVNEHDDLDNKRGRMAVIQKARTDQLLLGHKFKKILDSNKDHRSAQRTRTDTSGNCPMGCVDAKNVPIKERTQHFFADCPHRDERKANLWRQIKTLIRTEQPQTNTEVIPCWFARDGAPERTPVLPISSNALKELQKFPATAGILALCPNALPQAIQDAGGSGSLAERRILAGKIMARLTAFAFDLYTTTYPSK